MDFFSDQVLCAERVTQMTKTYNDIEAVTRLLEEKERDLELAARIGQTLLSKNKELTLRGDALDEQVTYATDKINQLKHDLSMKDELLKFYCQDLQDQSPTDGSPGAGPNLSKINLDSLQKKVVTLEEENLTLRLESAQLLSKTESYEDKEKKLVEDLLQQLADASHELESFEAELRLKTDESSRQKEEVTGLLSQVADFHKKVRQLTVENMDLSERLQASQESQRQLTKQLSGQQDRYDELFEMLEEAQDELRGRRHRDTPRARRHQYPSAALPSPLPPSDSLASELHNSMQAADSESSHSRAQSWKVFETAKAARKAASKSSRGSSVRMSTSIGGSQAPSVTSDDSLNSDGYSADMDSIYGSNSELGRPGIPGSNDLESALRRLALRRANEMNEHDFMESHRETRSEGMSPLRSGRTPDGRDSPASCYSYLGDTNPSPSGATFKMSDKLQIVKPLEGSVTLRHWQRLAQPHLGGLFERREGVKVRGERKLDLEGEVYTLSDFEEDDAVEADMMECPSRRFADSSTVYTFTNSLAGHPGDGGQHLPSESWGSGLHMLGMTSTPRSQNSTGSQKTGITSSTTTTTTTTSAHSGTYTMSLGLAAILQDRGASSGCTSAVPRPIASCSVMPPHTQASAQAAITTTAITTLSSAVTDSSPGIGEAGGSLFGKLINTGYSLLWNKAGSPPPPSSFSSSSPSFSSHTPPSSDLMSPSSLLSQERTTGGDAKSAATATTTAFTHPKSTVTSGSILPASSRTTGVLGAITNFRKSGIL